MLDLMVCLVFGLMTAVVVVSVGFGGAQVAGIYLSMINIRCFVAVVCLCKAFIILLC